MSNTSTVTPVAQETSATGRGLLEASVEAIRWLAQDSEAETELRQRIKQERREQLIGSCAKTVDLNIGGADSAIQSTTLHLRDPETLLRSASSLGFQRVELPMSAVDLPRSQPILLSNPDGARVAISRTKQGQIALHTPKGRSTASRIVRKHTVDRTAVYLKSKGMKLRARQLPNGEPQITAEEPRSMGRPDSAKVTTRVRRDGTVDVDIDRCKGNRCEQIVAGLAEAVGGKVTRIERKPAYFQLPGEPTKVRVKT